MFVAINDILESGLEGSEPVSIRARVYGRPALDSIGIHDKTGHTVITVRSDFKRSLNCARHGAFIRIYSPLVIDNKLFLGEESAVFTTQPIANLVEAPKLTVSDAGCLAQACAAEPGPKSGELLFKVVNKGIQRMVGQGTYTKCVIKDIAGTRSLITLWNSNMSKLQVDQVYALQGYKVENFPRNATVKHLQLVKNSTLAERVELAAQYKNISASDATYKGEIIGAEHLAVYSSCTICLKKTDEVECTMCKAPTKSNDFRVQLMMMTGEGMKKITAFCNVISTVLSKEFEKLEEKQAMVEQLNVEIGGKVFEAKIHFGVNNNTNDQECYLDSIKELEESSDSESGGN